MPRETASCPCRPHTALAETKTCLLKALCAFEERVSGLLVHLLALVAVGGFLEEIRSVLVLLLAAPEHRPLLQPLLGLVGCAGARGGRGRGRGADGKGGGEREERENGRGMRRGGSTNEGRVTE